MLAMLLDLWTLDCVFLYFASLLEGQWPVELVSNSYNVHYHPHLFISCIVL